MHTGKTALNVMPGQLYSQKQHDVTAAATNTEVPALPTAAISVPNCLRTDFIYSN